MNVVLWIGQGLLAAVFTYSGVSKSIQSRERMIAAGQTAAKIVPVPVLRTTGISELFGVVGVILPWVTGVARVLTPLSAVGFGLIMVMAAGVHTRLREPRTVAANLAVLAVAVTVALGRFADLG